METFVEAALEGQREQVMGMRQNGMLNINAANHTKMNAIGIAVTQNNKNAVELILEAGANIEISGCEGLSALSVAAREGHMGMVDLLLSAKARVDGPGRDSSLPTAVQAAMMTPMRLALRHNYPAIAKRLLSAKADPEEEGIIGDGPLAAAATNGEPSIIEALLAAAADVNRTGKQGQTPLMLAAINGHVEGVMLLAQAVGDLNAANEAGRTAVSLAAGGKEARCGEVVSALIAAKASYSQEDADGKRPLMWAALEGRAGCCQSLLESKANPIVPDKSLYPLNAAAKGGHVKVCKLLIDHNADVNAPDEHGDAPLLSAVEYRHGDVCTLLLQQKANPHQKNQVGLSPFQQSRNGRDRSVANAFKMEDVESFDYGAAQGTRYYVTAM